MSANSKIEWTGSTWNPVVGCSIVSPGCTHCYAMRMAARIERMGSAPHYAGTTKIVNGHPVWTGKMALAPEKTLTEPLRRKKPTTYFVNSMSDLFHEGVPDAWIDQVFAVMALCPQHTFQVLTKRSARMRNYLTDSAAECAAGKAGCRGRIYDACNDLSGSNGIGTGQWPLPNVWLGVSTERQKEANERIPDLLKTPAAIRFLSAEPLLGPLDLSQYLIGDEEHGIDFSRSPCSVVGGCVAWTPPLDWIIVGGESGPGARPMHPDWARSIRDQCTAARVAYFFKQHGQHLPHSCATWDHQGAHTVQTLGKPSFEAHGERFWTVGKKAAGRLLDGVKWNQMPGVAS